MRTPIKRTAKAYPERQWPLITRHTVVEADRFAIARQYGMDAPLASLDFCREYLHQEGDGGLEEIRGTPNDEYYELWVQAGRPTKLPRNPASLPEEDAP